MSLVIESRTVSEEDQGRWLREKGLHSEHITQYEQELLDMVEVNKNNEKQQIKDFKMKNKQLQRELDKKEKALAEKVALYALKKKQRIFGGGDEED